MPMDKIIPVKEGEYQELQGIPMGASVHFEGDAELVEGGLRISSIQLEPSENEATREVNRVTKGQEYSIGRKNGASESNGF